MRTLDPYEGSSTRANKRFYEILATDKEFRRVWMGIKPGQPVPELPAFHVEVSTRMREFGAATSFISCWHMSEYESAFFWQTYASQHDGVAIVSSVKRLSDCLALEPLPIYIGSVKYIDYDKDAIREGNTFIPIFHKRKSFAPENEIRACISHQGPMLALKKDIFQVQKSDFDSLPTSYLASCNIPILIEKLVIAPTTPEWAANVVKAVCSKYEQSFTIEKSSILDPAIF